MSSEICFIFIGLCYEYIEDNNMAFEAYREAGIFLDKGLEDKDEEIIKDFALGLSSELGIKIKHEKLKKRKQKEYMEYMMKQEKINENSTIKYTVEGQFTSKKELKFNDIENFTFMENINLY